MRAYREKIVISLAVGATMAAFVTPSGSAHAMDYNDPLHTYIVQLTGEPIAGTKSEDEVRLDIDTSEAQVRGKQLARDRKKATKLVPGVEKLYDYNLTFNGFAARMSSRQAEFLATRPGIHAVVKDQILKVNTISTPAALGLTGDDGMWTHRFGSPESAGEGMIIGVLDTGISDDSPSFAALAEPRPDAGVIKSKWRGTCDKGIACTNKIIGGRWFLAGQASPEDFRSPRDYDGHGTHTASTAAGNHGVTATINGRAVGKVSGMAPAARIAAYKVCWKGGTDGGCSAADSLAAIDQATADGVDIINFSVGGSATSNIDPVSIALFNAAKAGIFVAASAGNSGESGPSSSAHNAPWITTVAASTHNRTWNATVTLGDGSTLTGAGLGTEVPQAPLISAEAAVRTGADEKKAKVCHPDAPLDPS
nr:S8 family serine peptidase [Longispora sp. (in: high G+C Gram-positive bacteria)]